jgi:hypothetical protein
MCVCARVCACVCVDIRYRWRLLRHLRWILLASNSIEVMNMHLIMLLSFISLLVRCAGVPVRTATATLLPESTKEIQRGLYFIIARINSVILTMNDHYHAKTKGSWRV